MKKNTKSLATGVAVASLLATGAVATNAFINKLVKSLLYRHHRDDDGTNTILEQYDACSIYVKNNKGIRLRGILIESENASKTMIICHPFALEAKDMAMYIPFFKDKIQDINILLVDASAHGQSDGYIRGFGLKDVDDLIVWNKHLLKTYGDDHKIVLYGKECGSNTILNAAGKDVLTNVVAIISDGAFTSTYDIIGERLLKDYRMPKYPALPLIKRQIYKETKMNIKESTVSLVKNNTIPTLYFHASEDAFVPLKHVYPLFNSNGGEKILFVVKEEHYLCDVEESDDFKSTFKEFVEKYINVV